jgi:hypothetical protein
MQCQCYNHSVQYSTVLNRYWYCILQCVFLGYYLAKECVEHVCSDNRTIVFVIGRHRIASHHKIYITRFTFTFTSQGMTIDKGRRRQASTIDEYIYIYISYHKHIEYHIINISISCHIIPPQSRK